MATSSVSSSTSSSSNVTSTSLQTSSRARVNGTSLISGLDTDTLIQQLTATTRSKIAKQQIKMQRTQWQRDSYREATTKMSDFSKKYFSYTNAPKDNISNAKFFNVATINNTSSLVSVSGDTTAASRMQIGSITQLAKAASFSSSKQAATEAIYSGTIKTAWTQSNVTGKTFSFSYGGKDYSVSVPQNILEDNFSTDTDKQAAMSDLASAINEQINNISDLSGKLSFSVSSSGSVGTFTLKQTANGTSGDLKISAEDGSLAKALGFSTTKTGATGSTGSSVDASTLFVNKTLSSALAGSTLTFTLNGISKDITFNASESAQYADTNSLTTYLQNALNTAYGSGKVTVSTENNGLKIITGTASSPDTTSVLSISSTDNTNVLGETGALKIGAGESNRLETAKTLKELSAINPTSGKSKIDGLTPNSDGNYVMNINGKQFTFSQDTKLSSVLSQINDDTTANVNITYSSVTNTFSVTSKSSGAQGKIDIGDASGNLASKLFGNANNSIQSSGAISDYTLSSSAAGKSMTVSYGGNNYTFSLPASMDSTAATADKMNNIVQELNKQILATPSIKDKFAFSVDSSGSSFDLTQTDGTSNDLKISGDLASALGFTATTTGAKQISGATVDINTLYTGKDLSTALSGKAITFSLNGGASSANITFDPADIAQYKTADGIKNYLQTKLDSALGSGNVTVSNNDGILKFTTTGSNTLQVSGDTASLNIASGSTTSSSGGYTVNAGKDAQLKVSFDNGNTFTDISRTENTFSLDGVNITLLGTTDQTKSLADTTIKFTTNTNVDDLVKKIKTFVDDYNSMITLIDGKVSEAKEKDPSYDPLSDEQKKQMTQQQIDDWNTHAKKGILQNDSTLSGASNDLRDAMTSLVGSSAYKALSKIGINTASYDYDPSTNGKLSVDEDALKTAITNNPDAVAELFTDPDNGIAAKVKSACDKYVGTFGGDGLLISLAGTATTIVDQSTLGKQLSNYTSTIKDLNTKLSDQQDQLWSKFTVMEEQLSRLNAQATYLQNSSSNS